MVQKTAEEGMNEVKEDVKKSENPVKIHYTTVKWDRDISKIEGRYDGELPKGKVIFYGSSSIRKWKTMQEDLPDIEVLNHGFGGSTSLDCLYYANRMIVPFEPRAIVFYAGTNDGPKGRSARQIYKTTIDFFKYVHYELPETKIYYIEQFRQPDREAYWPVMDKLNEKVKKYCKDDPLVTFIKTSDVLYDEYGYSIPGYVLDDGLHFTEAGYEAWTSAIKPVLYKDLVEKEKKDKDNKEKEKNKEKKEKDNTEAAEQTETETSDDAQE